MGPRGPPPAGGALESLRGLAVELGVIDRVRFEGTHSLDEMAAVMATADMQLVCLKDDPLFRLTMPSKIQAILASGQPLLTSAPGDAARLTDESGAGWSAHAGDPEELAQLLVKASALSQDDLQRMGRIGRAFYDERLSAKVGSQMLESALAQAVGKDANA